MKKAWNNRAGLSLIFAALTGCGGTQEVQKTPVDLTRPTEVQIDPYLPPAPPAPSAPVVKKAPPAPKQEQPPAPVTAQCFTPDSPDPVKTIKNDMLYFYKEGAVLTVSGDMPAQMGATRCTVQSPRDIDMTCAQYQSQPLDSEASVKPVFMKKTIPGGEAFTFSAADMEKSNLQMCTFSTFKP